MAAERDTHPSPWVTLWQLITRVQRDRITPLLGLRNALGVTLPLVWGAATGMMPLGLAISTGALNAAFTDSSEPYRVRGWRMVAASILVGGAVSIGEWCGNDHVLAVGVTTVWAFAAGLLVALSSTASDLGVISLVTLVVYSAVPASLDRVLMAGLLALGGGLLQTALSLALWPVSRYGPERRALGELYLELARSIDSPIHALLPPPASSQSTLAQQSLASLGRDHTIEGERYRALLSQAERIRLSVMLLGRLRTRIHREDPDDRQSTIVDGYFEIAGRMLTSIGEGLRTGTAVKSAGDCIDKLEAVGEALGASSSEAAPELAAMLADAGHQMDALSGQLRSAAELAGHLTPEGQDAFERLESRQPWGLRLRGTFAILHANLSLSSTACRHAIRLATCVALGDALSRGLGVGRYYWLPMTVAIVLKPDFSATVSRGVLRLAGTFAGLVLATALFHVVPAGSTFEIFLVFLFIFVLRCFGGANYGIFVVAVTAMVVVLLALAGNAPSAVIAARGWNTALGGTIALMAYWLWPTWERNQVREGLAKLLDSYRAYFHLIRRSYVEIDLSFADDLDRARQAGRLARSNLEASFDRLTAEPGTKPESIGTLSGILANSHRLAHAMMALEAGLTQSRSVPARAKFPIFANDVELTLYYLASTLRGSPLSASDLPDLRHAHSALVHTESPAAERYALVNVETDRITNSLNTLSGEILGWVPEKVERAA